MAAGECDVAITNTYYYVRLLQLEQARRRTRLAEKVGVILPEPERPRHAHQHLRCRRAQDTRRNREAAVQFLEYLASDEAQAYFANGNNEWPAVSDGAGSQNPALAALGTFKDDPLNVGAAREEPAGLAQKISTAWAE